MTSNRCHCMQQSTYNMFVNLEEVQVTVFVCFLIYCCVTSMSESTYDKTCAEEERECKTR